MVLGMLAKMWGFWTSRRHAIYKSDTEGSSTLQSASQRKPGLFASALHYLKTYFAIPASFIPFLSHHHQLYYSHTIPKRLDLLIVFGFWAVCIILACVDYQSFSGNIQ